MCPERNLSAFLRGELGFPPELPAASVFSGAGVGDWGFRKAGFRFRAHLELRPERAAILRLNFPDAKVIVGRIEEQLDDFTEAAVRGGPLALLTVTPPCAGLSSAGRWKTGSPFSDEPSDDSRNYLALVAVEAVHRLSPFIVFLENVAGFRTRRIRDPRTGQPVAPLEAFLQGLPDYDPFVEVVQMADYGVPQRRERLVVVLGRRDELGGLSPSDILPTKTHAKDGAGALERWPISRETLAGYAALDASEPGKARDPTDPLHVVPTYTRMQYSWISRIPPHSARSAYDNSRCDGCGRRKVPKGRAACDRCGAVLRGRPRIYEEGHARLIKGQGTSYRRIPSDLPLPTITTNNGQYGGDTKIHPWQNRVLSVREVLDHQTVPRDFLWHGPDDPLLKNLIRESVGESIPPWFTYQQGLMLRALLLRQSPSLSRSRAPVLAAS